MEIIRSRQNEKIRLARGLRQRKKREIENRFLLEGLFHLGEALEAKAAIDYVLVAPQLIRNEFGQRLLTKIEEADIPLFEIEAQLLDELSQREHSSGFLGICHSNYQALLTINPERVQRMIALIKPQDPGNLGSILRSLDAFGADGIVLLDGGVDAYHPAAVRAGMGAHFWQTIVRATSADFLDWAKEQGFQLLGSSAQGGVSINALTVKKPYILLLGSEREGLSDEQKALCEQLISLPMRGRSTSLNLSVAAGILLYALCEQEE